MVYSEIENLIGYVFKDKKLLETALTHSSYANDTYQDRLKSNERLEFLGDALLDASVGEELYFRFSRMNEGQLTKLRADIVCEDSLSDVAKKLGINRYILLSRGEMQSGGNLRASLLADAVEALIAAVFLDSKDFKTTKEFAIRILGDNIEKAIEGKLNRDSKSALQEKLQAKGITDIKYRLVSEDGPDHDKTFTYAVLVMGKEYGRGSGKRKKLAESEAAQEALNRMEEEN